MSNVMLSSKILHIANASLLRHYMDFTEMPLNIFQPRIHYDDCCSLDDCGASSWVELKD